MLFPLFLPVWVYYKGKFLYSPLTVASFRCLDDDFTTFKDSLIISLLW